MSEKYKNAYSYDNLYGHTVDILRDLNPEGVHLDIGCGYAAINTGIIENGLNLKYIGIDADVEAIEENRLAGIEAYQYIFGESSTEDYEYIEKVLNGRKLSSISMLDVLEHLVNPQTVLDVIHKIAMKYHVPVIISVPNVAHRDIAFKLLEGRFEYTESGLLDNTHLSFFTEDRLTRLLKQNGFEQISSNDVLMEKSDQHFPEDCTFISEGSLAYQYLNWLKKLVDPSASVNQFLRAYLAREKTLEKPMRQKEKRPFLSVVTRTQGKRPQALAETLLCLTGQENTDFEVLVIGHKMTIENQLRVERIIEDLPEWIRNKTRLIKVDYGTRTTPLNIGFSEAKGKYITILDDDDIVFDNWVEEFYKLDQQHSGAVLHTYAFAQNWMTIGTSAEAEALRACSSPKTTFCKDFDILGELTVNYCPTLSLAFPAYVFQKLNIHFDEELTTTEDWDFLMRTSFVCGVVNSKKPTCVYRLWTNAESSQTVHSRNEWKENHLLIQRKFDKVPIVLPIGAASKFTRKGDWEEPSQDLPTLFIDKGDGFSEDSTIAAQKSKTEAGFFEFPGINTVGRVSTLRFDPTDSGTIVLYDIEIRVETSKGLKTYYTKDIKSNGVKIDGKIIFIKPDPQIILSFPVKEIINSVMIKYQILYSIPHETMDNLIIKKGKVNHSLPYRTLRKVFQILKKIIRLK